MNQTELELIQTQVSNMSTTEFGVWLDDVENTAYLEGRDDADSRGSYAEGYSDGYAQAEEEWRF